MMAILRNRARSFVTIMIIIAVSALILRFGIGRIIKISITQNEANAQSVLKLISTALESYARDHAGTYPITISVLTKNKPPYLDKDYTASSPLKGYDYSCSKMEAAGYICSAEPLICNLTGKTIYTVTTGGLLVSEGCGRKE